MRKSLIVAALAAIALGGTVGCAHPNEAPLPGETRTPTTASTGNTSAPDETKAVCAEATSTSTTAISTLKAKVAEATAAQAAGDQGKLIAAQLAARTTATEWSNKLTSLSARPIKPQVKTVLTDGAKMINDMTANPASLTPASAEAKLNDFTGKLAGACAGV
jgi:hypothetical protein